MRPIDCAEIYGDARHYDLQTREITEDLPFYLRLAGIHGGPILELACGTGRVGIPLAQAGYEVVGLDTSLPMLRHARRKAVESGVSIGLIRADCRRFAFRRLFRLIIFPFNAIAHLHERSDLEACFGCVRDHLAAGGRFVVVHFNPNLHYLVRDPLEHFPVDEYDDPDGKGRVVITETSTYDRALQVNRIVWHYQIGGEPDARTACLNMRILFPQELDALLWYNGFDIERKYGDCALAPFEASSPSQVVVATPRVRPW